ncbi:MAG: hypothetical protein ACOC9D_01570 [Thermodesulfobacteriota bacterium]
MYTLKTIAREAIPDAVDKAMRYRLLNEPLEAESICLDILQVEPGNQGALITLLLALTDSFKQQLSPAFSRAQAILEKLEDRYLRAYYGGIIMERRAKVHLERPEPGSGRMAYDWFSKAMNLYEEVMNSSSEVSQDALLRWNACARNIMKNPDIVHPEEDSGEEMLE